MTFSLKKKILYYAGDAASGDLYVDSDGHRYVDISDKKAVDCDLYYASPVYEEPESPVDFEFELRGRPERNHFSFNYMMIDKERMTIDYYLRNAPQPSEHTKEIVKAAIESLKENYEIVPQKPEWLPVREFDELIEKATKYLSKTVMCGFQL